MSRIYFKTSWLGPSFYTANSLMPKKVLKKHKNFSNEKAVKTVFQIFILKLAFDSRAQLLKNLHLFLKLLLGASFEGSVDKRNKILFRISHPTKCSTWKSRNPQWPVPKHAKCMSTIWQILLWPVTDQLLVTRHN